MGQPAFITSTKKTSFKRVRIWSVVTFGAGILLVTAAVLQSKIIVFYNEPDIRPTTAELGPEAFPISVNPETKTITDNPLVESYLKQRVASNHTPPFREQGWFALISGRLAQMDWYQNLASPISRILVIDSGQRAEEVASNFANILGWSAEEKKTFVSFIEAETPPLPDGKFYPGKYIFEKNASPDIAALAVADRFNAEIRTRYTNDIEAVVPLREALIIASMIEREAYDFTDMRYISGVIWNRLFIDMRLQLDATLQYARGSKPNEPWWPVPVPADKYIDSPYNTYKTAGLPPAPISNPSIDAIIATLNPRKTNCLFYFHTNDGAFHCTPTYEEHVVLLKEKFGQGR